MSANFPLTRPHATVVLAMTADGKIADATSSPARFSSPNDKSHLEKQIANADAVLFGAGTLRAYGTTLSVSNPTLLQTRQNQGKPPQPVQIVCSRLANIDPQLRFFSQSVPRWLIAGASGAKNWEGQQEFERIIVAETPKGEINWTDAYSQLATLGLRNLAILGGGKLVASLLVENLIDEFWLTICPLILGGAAATTPVEGGGFLPQLAPRLELLSVETIEQEVFLHYRLQH
ncbi:RibD family protein [Microcoleus sp. FACHB-831]|uniref:RibD family protein n=1 Tax=Microcoleus sp. FACHB-831 TaxID=2692827 RepID=UPI001687E7D6|nr:RibD family protein [Microcoleus sp. FACHB-831]MBD1924600.1 RibD family protein [Microcoleus sp. FACHB-831]